MKAKYRRLLFIFALLCLLAIPMTLSDISLADAATRVTASLTADKAPSKTLSKKEATASALDFTTDDVPAYAEEPYVVVNDNVPGFTKKELTTTAFEYYSSLDSLGRCDLAYANVCEEIMPTEERSEIGSVKPTGWHTVKYDCVDGKYLYNRCHLIGYQLSGENANNKNLITGTRYLNVDGMLPFENLVDDYVEETGNHVLYRVTPIFEGDNLVASGVLMEAESVEDKGEGVEFCVYCYNTQPAVEIDYESGESNWDGTYPETDCDGSSVVTAADAGVSSEQSSESQHSDKDSDSSHHADDNEKASDAHASEGQADTAESSPAATSTYILNTNTGKFHDPGCRSVKKMSDKKECKCTRDELIAQGYEPCLNCNP